MWLVVVESPASTLRKWGDPTFFFGSEGESRWLIRTDSFLVLSQANSRKTRSQGPPSRDPKTTRVQSLEAEGNLGGFSQKKGKGPGDFGWALAFLAPQS